MQYNTISSIATFAPPGSSDDQFEFDFEISCHLSLFFQNLNHFAPFPPDIAFLEKYTISMLKKS